MISEPSGELPRRLHPLSIVLHAAGYLRQLIVPFFLLLLFSRGNAWELYAAVLVIPLGCYEVVRYWRTTYAIRDEQLIVRQGLLFRSERHIPFSRIQNLDLVQNVVQRLFRVAEVRIETAGGAEPEAVLRVIAVDEVQRIRQRIFGQREGARPASLAKSAEPVDFASLENAASPGSFAATEREQPWLLEEPGGTSAGGAEPEILLLRLPLGELVKLGLITYRGLAVVALAMGVAWQLNLGDALREQFEARLEWLGQFVQQWDGASWWLAAAAVMAGGFLLLSLLSVAWAVLTLYDYQLVRVGDDLRVSCGLFTRLSATIPRQRIQLVSLHQSPLHRMWNRVTISIETAGGGRNAESVPVNRRWLVPLVAPERIAELLPEIQPHIELLDLKWQPLAGKAAKRMMRKALLVSLVLGVLPAIPLAVAWRGWALAWWPILAAGLVLHARAAARRMGYARSAHGIAFRSGVLSRRTSATRFDRIQVVIQRQSPFDRRYRMASLAVDTAGAGAAGHRIDIPYLEAEVADRLRADLAWQAQRTGFHWA